MNPFSKAMQARKRLKEMFPGLTVHVSLRPKGLILEVEPGPDGRVPKDLPKEIDGVLVTL